VRALVRVAARLDPDVAARRTLARGLALIGIGTVLASWSPWRVPPSYGTTLVADSTSAFAFVRGALRPGDAVATTEPQPPTSLLEVGRADYDVSIPLLSDFVYRRDGRLVDRNASAEAVTSLEDLADAIARHDRLWVVVNRLKLRWSRGREIAWGYPAARLEVFLRENLDLRYRSFGYDVFLWDATAGKFRTFGQHGPPPI
jgi:hypothetical protein